MAAFATDIRPADQGFFNDHFGDLPEELAAARDEHKGLLIMFETDDCPWCMRMKQTVLNRVNVQAYYQDHFRVLMLNAESPTELVDFQGQDTTEKAFSLKALRVRATPVFAFFDAKGALLYKHTGVTQTPKEFLWLGEFVVGQHYQQQKFSQYRKARIKAERSAS